MRVAMDIVGQEETVGESSVSSGCWGEDSDHEFGIGATELHVLSRLSVFPAHFRFKSLRATNSAVPDRQGGRELRGRRPP